MSTLLKIVPVSSLILPLLLLLLLRISRAEESRSKEYSAKASFLDESYNLQKFYNDDYENFFVFSANYPSRLSFERSNGSDYKYNAIIERMPFNGDKRKSCSFPAFDDTLATYYLRLLSTYNGYEILQIVRTYDDPAKNNSVYFYIVNTADCKYIRTEILKGYDYFKYGGSFLVYDFRNEEYFELFSFDGQERCGGYICKYSYYFGKESFGEPVPFNYPDYTPSTKFFYVASSYDHGYFALLKNQNKCSLQSVSSSGALINSIDDNYNRRLKFFRFSTYYDAFGACYTTEDKSKEIYCLQLDGKLNYKFNKSLDYGYESKYLAVHNLQQGGLLLLSSFCDKATSAGEECQEAEEEFRLTKFDANGAYSDFSKLRDGACSFNKRRQQFTFFEEDGKVCLFYPCYGQLNANRYDYTLRSKCF